ncbi:glycosyltransferase [Dactylosporangium sp. AC04546]|uniref:glycosyltransferase n=1 Tax=Dactylosporangium sp. AC04546 TaxID=2862460 RepID=UPI00271556F4|nr:glycosyltransferase [Dactylosporangium sp. AC04546]WVK82637.1 glycosyltransferase [Dactylosporangium sp. AC04546]
MSHIPVSVIVAAGGSPDDFHACLESLRPSLGMCDEVVCVLPAGRPELRAELRGQSWLRVLDGGPVDPGERWATGLEATRHPIVVLLDGDVVLSAHWLDPVLEAFGDPAVVAAGPRCQHSYGPQQADLPDDALTSAAAFKAFARDWRQEHRDEFTDVDRLGPVCVAIRRDALAIAGGPTADLPYEGLAVQGRMVVAHAALVAHVASPMCGLRPADDDDAEPLLTASLIAKDEQDVLGRSLEALRDLVDEIVVYDTGSSDGTVEIARRHGARVVEGFWSDHFGDARNRCLEHCRGRWVLWVDADEVFTGDAPAVRDALRLAESGALFATIDNREGHEGGAGSSTIYYPRMFRRARGRVYGRLHEQVVDRVTGRALTGSLLPELVLDHSGYTRLRALVKNKAQRNLRLAKLAAEDVSGLTAVGNLARSQLGSGHIEECIDTARRGLAEAREHTHHVLFLKILADAYLAVGRLAEANETIEDLRKVANTPFTVGEHEVKLRFAEGDYERALELIGELPESGANDLLYGIGKGRFAGLHVDALSRLDRHEDAARELRSALLGGQVPIPVARLAQVLGAAGGSLAEVAELLPRESLRSLLFTIAEAPPEAADELLEALWRRYPGEPGILALAARVGRQVPLIRAMEWSARLRQHGFPARCTLLTLSADTRRTPRERTLAAAIALEMFHDEAALPLLREALAGVLDADSAAVLDEMRILAPQVSANIELADA